MRRLSWLRQRKGEGVPIGRADRAGLAREHRVVAIAIGVASRALDVAMERHVTVEFEELERVVAGYGSRGAGQEANPFLRPFANSGAIYAATQVSPALMDFLGGCFKA